MAGRIRARVAVVEHLKETDAGHIWGGNFGRGDDDSFSQATCITRARPLYAVRSFVSPGQVGAVAETPKHARHALRINCTMQRIHLPRDFVIADTRGQRPRAGTLPTLEKGHSVDPDSDFDCNSCCGAPK